MQTRIYVCMHTQVRTSMTIVSMMMKSHVSYHRIILEKFMLVGIVLY